MLAGRPNTFARMIGAAVAMAEVARGGEAENGRRRDCLYAQIVLVGKCLQDDTSDCSVDGH